MDRVELSVADVDRLLEWRDGHLAEVRSFPSPLRAVEIAVRESGYTIKGIRDDHRLDLHIGRYGQRVGNLEFEYAGGGQMQLRKNRDEMKQEDVQSALTVYCSLMALMVYGERPVMSAPDAPSRKAPETRKRPATKRQRRTTYILQTRNGKLLASPRGSHASPSGIFTVRGHYRHYKSGKVVWIAEYQKGTKKKRRKTYKMGGIDSDERKAGADVGSAVRSGSGDRLKSAD